MRISNLYQRLHSLGAKPCHADRVLRGWSQVCSYDKKHSPAETFFPLALRNELPAIEAELDGLARLRSEHPANGHGSHDRSPPPNHPPPPPNPPPPPLSSILSRKRERRRTRKAIYKSCGRGGKRSATRISQ
jgi:hypothetical protein